MSNHYATELLVAQHQSELRHEAEQERLARRARVDSTGPVPRPERVGRPGRRWWQRLTLRHPGSSVAARGSSC